MGSEDNSAVARKDEEMSKIKTDYTREELIELCEKAIVSHDEWNNRDTSSAQSDIGSVWVFLKAGCDYRILHEGNTNDKYCKTDTDTIWIQIAYSGFASFENGTEPEWETFFLPTPAKIEACGGLDWY